MSNQMKKQDKGWKQGLKELSVICHCAAEALGISDGEFWVWYGSPFMLVGRKEQ